MPCLDVTYPAGALDATTRTELTERLTTTFLHWEGAPEIDFESSYTVERDRQRNIDAETPLGLRHGFQAPVEERFRRTSRSVCALGV